MVTLLTIPKEAHEELEDGNAVRIKLNGRPGFAIGFEEDFDKACPLKPWEWEVEHGWDHLRSDDNPSPFGETEFEQADPVEAQP